MNDAFEFIKQVPPVSISIANKNIDMNQIN
jgi:hypothetical protein